MQRSTSTHVANGGLLSPSAPTPRATGAPSAADYSRLALPSRHSITNETIADDYVNFILYCNPAVPPGTDSSVLRETFLLLPKSEGKTFSTFTLYELIGKLNQRDEVKTWGDLALSLGVERPKAEKQQSSQKIQQYAVRLKRWMKAMHVDAFFNYLYGEDNEYFLDIPPEGALIADIPRDGVAPQDDMALRALLPHIRPRRGRRARDDKEPGGSPSKIARVDAYVSDEYPPTTSRQDSLHGPWSALPGGGNDDFKTATGQDWTHDHPSLSAHPQSAITPSTKSQFWTDEPKSAVTSNRAGRPGSKRHGPKVVSSAWKSGQSTSGKTRGRPPNSRLSNQAGPYSAFPADTPASATPIWKLGNNSADSGWNRDERRAAHEPPQSAVFQSLPAPQAAPPALPTLNTALSMSNLQQQLYSESPGLPRLSEKPKGLSLHVPQRVGSEIRLATPPPPVVTVNGQMPASPGQHSERSPSTSEAPEILKVRLTSDLPSPGPPPGPPSESGSSEKDKPKVYFKDPSIRTNMDQLEGYFAHEIMTGVWRDKDGNRLPICSVDEAFAIVRKVIKSLLDAAVTEVGFILNVSALAGGKLLMTTTSLQITVTEVRAEETLYTCKWLLQLGDLKGDLEMQETVRHDAWKKPLHSAPGRNVEAAVADPVLPRTEDSKVMAASVNQDGADVGGAQSRTDAVGSLELPDIDSAEYWKEKYRELAEMYKKKDSELCRMQSAVMRALQDPRLDRT